MGRLVRAAVAGKAIEGHRDRKEERKAEKDQKKEDKKQFTYSPVVEVNRSILNSFEGFISQGITRNPHTVLFKIQPIGADFLYAIMCGR